MSPGDFCAADKFASQTPNGASGGCLPQSGFENVSGRVCVWACLGVCFGCFWLLFGFFLVSLLGFGAGVVFFCLFLGS